MLGISGHARHTCSETGLLASLEVTLSDLWQDVRQRPVQEEVRWAGVLPEEGHVCIQDSVGSRRDSDHVQECRSVPWSKACRDSRLSSAKVVFSGR